MSSDPSAQAAGSPQSPEHHLRFHAPHLHLTAVFGSDWFGRKAESFARFFGTPVFLVLQSMLVGVWIAFNVWGLADRAHRGADARDPHPHLRRLTESGLRRFEEVHVGRAEDPRLLHGLAQSLGAGHLAGAAEILGLEK